MLLDQDQSVRDGTDRAPRPTMITTCKPTAAPAGSGFLPGRPFGVCEAVPHACHRSPHGVLVSQGVPGRSVTAPVPGGSSVMAHHHNGKARDDRDRTKTGEGDQRTAERSRGPGDRGPAEPCRSFGPLDCFVVVTVVAPAVISHVPPSEDSTVRPGSGPSLLPYPPAVPGSVRSVNLHLSDDLPDGLTQTARSFVGSHGIKVGTRSIEDHRRWWLERDVPAAVIDRMVAFQQRWGGLVLPPGPQYDGGPSTSTLTRRKDRPPEGGRSRQGTSGVQSPTRS